MKKKSPLSFDSSFSSLDPELLQRRGKNTLFILISLLRLIPRRIRWSQFQPRYTFYSSFITVIRNRCTELRNLSWGRVGRAFFGWGAVFRKMRVTVYLIREAPMFEVSAAFVVSPDENGLIIHWGVESFFPLK